MMEGFSTPPMHIPDFLIIDAVRYCLGRQTYAVSEMTGWLIANWPELPKSARHQIIIDVERELNRDDESRKAAKRLEQTESWHFPLGSDADRQMWEMVRQLWRKDHS
jgi:hypothetical protein